jgi:hypothetical protein
VGGISNAESFSIRNGTSKTSLNSKLNFVIAKQFPSRTHVPPKPPAIQSPHLVAPTNKYIHKAKALNLMGAVLACIGLAANSIKKSRDKKQASQSGANYQSESQPLPSQGVSQGGQDSQSVRDAQRGLQDEHLASVPPIVEPVGESKTEAEAAGTKEVQRNVATGAPVPVHTA